MSQQLRNAQQWVKVGISEYNSKRYNECLYACDLAIQLDSYYAKAYHGRGLALARLKRYEEALITYQKATLLAPEDATFHANVAGLLFYKREYEEAGLAYRRVIQLDSQFEVVYVEKSEVLLKKAFKRRTQYSPTFDRLNSAIRALREVLLFNPKYTIAFAEIGKIQKERGLALARYGKYEEAINAYLEASELSPEDVKLHANLAELFFNEEKYEKARLSYKRAIQLDSQFEAVYIEKTRVLFNEVLKWLTPQVPSLNTHTLAISAFHKILLFNPDDPTTLAEIGRIQKEVEHLRNHPTIYYRGTLIWTNKHTNSVRINVRSEQPDEEVRILFPKKEQDGGCFSKKADGWAIALTFSLTETYFRIEVLRNDVAIAYGSYCIRSGYLVRRDTEYNIYLTIIPEPETVVYKPTVMQSKEQHKDKISGSIIYVPNRARGRNRRVRRGS